MGVPEETGNWHPFVYATMLEWSFASITIVSDTFRSLEESMERKYPQPLRFQMLHV